MRCDLAQERLSEMFDRGAPLDDAEATAHVAVCGDCRAFAATATALRQRLRVEAIADPPDVAGAVTRRLMAAEADDPVEGRRRRPSLAAAVAACVAGALVGASLVGGAPGSGPGTAAADLASRVVVAERALDSLSATVEVVERGWHPDVAVRTLRGTLRYRAPESFALRLDDVTTYPSAGWRPNDITLVVDDDRMWSSGLRDCPPVAQPACTPPAPRVRAVVDREPFAEAMPVPLDLVLPVDGLRGAAPPPVIGRRVLDGRDAVGVAVTAAQVEGILAPLRSAGNLREVHPADVVDLWLDDATLTPLLVVVRPAPGPDRAAWAARRGFTDGDEPIVEVRLTSVAVNGGVADDAFPPPPVAGVSAGFRDGPAPAAPTPAVLPAGMRPFRSGSVQVGAGPAVAVRTWTDGRAWMALRAFPPAAPPADAEPSVAPGTLLRPIDLGDAGVGYVGGDGRTIVVLGDDRAIAVTGSVDLRTLTAAAASAGVHGRDPSGGTAAPTVAQARAARPGLLLPADLDGFGPPALQLDGTTVTAAFAGAGDRGFVLVQERGDALRPAADPDARGVRVRGVVGRYLPAAGELSWVGDHGVISIRSTTLAVEELVDIADRLETP